jgi:hypothetical protein
MLSCTREAAGRKRAMGIVNWKGKEKESKRQEEKKKAWRERKKYGPTDRVPD